MLSLAKIATLHRFWIQIGLFLCLALGGVHSALAAKKSSTPAPETATADKASSATNFDHFQTGYPLLGAHQLVPCESCHVRGFFEGTPTLCVGCHNGTIAVGKGPNHVATTAACDSCHNPASVEFAIAGGFDHVGVTGNCASCHNGIKATGKGGSHIASTDKCEACHRNTTAWSADSVDHSQVQGRCSSCHNGTIATGKGANHIPTVLPSARECDACHRSTADWGVVNFGHGGVTTDCVSCHDGRRLIGMDKSHIRSTDLCEACHKGTNSFSVVPKVDHDEVIGTCSSCHLKDKSPSHLQTTQECDVCHNTDDWSAALPEHVGPDFVSNCVRCHNGQAATGRSAKHVPTGSITECANCHKVAPDTFDNAALFDHNMVSAQRCDSCHNGSFPGVTAKSSTHVPVPAGSDCNLCHRVPPDTFGSASSAGTFSHTFVTAQRCDSCHNPTVGPPNGALPKSVTHVATKPGQDCKDCHADTITFTGATFSHDGITGNCAVACHTVGSPGAPKDPTHIPTIVGLDCNACHRVPPPDTFATAALFDHSLVTAQRCDACHDGSHDGAGAIGKNAGHVPTQPGQDCNVCHKTTTTFVGAKFDHTGVTGGCGTSTCHGPGGSGMQKDATHVPTPTGMDCSACHRGPPETFATAALFNHTLVVPAMTCVACHSGTFPAAQGKSPAHIASTTACEKCHRTATWADIIKPLDHTQVTGSCNGCHLADKPPTHLPVPAGSDCSLCHVTTPLSWATAPLFNHSQVTAMRCDACHNDTYDAYGAVAKNAAHIPTVAGQDCGVCHRVPPDTFASAAAFNHSLVTSFRCSQCHNGQFAAAGAAGKGTAHFVTTLECDVCHTTAAGWAARYRHTAANYPGDHNASVTCRSCHTTNTSTATWTSPALKPFCGGCHERDYSPGDHQKVQTPPTNYTASELKDCAGACHVYATPGGAIVRNRSGEHRVNAGSF